MIYLYLRNENNDAAAGDWQRVPGIGQIDRVYLEQGPGHREAWQELKAALQPGDRILAVRPEDVADHAMAFLEQMHELAERGVTFCVPGINTALTETAAVLAELRRMGGPIQNRVEMLRKKASGRRPIDVDETLFTQVVAQWRAGVITARQAMAKLNLKPNTFYRRVKERTSDVKNKEEILAAAKELKNEIKAGVEAERQELKERSRKIISEAKSSELKEQIRDGLENTKAVAEMKLSMAKENVEKDLRDVKELHELKQQVRRESQEQKNNN